MFNKTASKIGMGKGRVVVSAYVRQVRTNQRQPVREVVVDIRDDSLAEPQFDYVEADEVE